MRNEHRQRIQSWRERLQTASGKSQLGMLEAAHNRAGLDDRYGHMIERECEVDTDMELFDLMGRFVGQGVMPPPELLLTMLEAWYDYLNEQYEEVPEIKRDRKWHLFLTGQTTEQPDTNPNEITNDMAVIQSYVPAMKTSQKANALERHFIGAPIRNAGNYAERRRKDAKRLSMMLEPQALLMGTHKDPLVRQRPLTRDELKCEKTSREALDSIWSDLEEFKGRSPEAAQKWAQRKRRKSKDK